MQIFLLEEIYHGSTKTIQLKLIDVDFDLFATMKKYANGMNYVSSMVLENGKLISDRKLQLMIYALFEETFV